MKSLIKANNGVYLKDVYLDDTNDVLLKVNMIGLCRTDLLVAQNMIETKDDLILGHEFSAQVVKDKKGILQPGEWVGVNPLWGNHFMGLDFNGAICEYVSVPSDKIIPTSSNDPRLIAYLEPTAASMAVLKALKSKNDVIAVVGNNRIAQLTTIILLSYGYKVEALDEKSDFKSNYYDVVIETVFEETVLQKIINSLKSCGTLVVKSRKKTPVNIIASDLVTKEITLKAVNYYDFHSAMRWLEANSKLINFLLGDVYKLEDWKMAFDNASCNEINKVFIKI